MLRTTVSIGFAALLGFVAATHASPASILPLVIVLGFSSLIMSLGLVTAAKNRAPAPVPVRARIR